MGDVVKFFSSPREAAATALNVTLRSALVLVPGLLLAACNQPAPKVETRQAAPIPEKLCQSAQSGLEGLKPQMVMEYTADGTATLPEGVWLRQDRAVRDLLIQSLAFHSSCKSSEPLFEKEVTIRNETGALLERQTVDLTIDPAALEGQ